MKATKILYITFGAVALVMLLSIALTSCNTAKQAQRKDDKAKDRVLGSRKLMDIVGEEYVKLNPCVPDSVMGKPDTTYLKGETEYVLVELEVNKFKAIDTTIKGVRVRIDTSGNLKLNIPDVKSDIREIKIPYYIKDNQAIKILEDKIESQRLEYKLISDDYGKVLLGYAEQKDELAEYKKNKNIWLWVAIILGIIVIFEGYLLIKKPKM